MFTAWEACIRVDYGVVLGLVDVHLGAVAVNARCAIGRFRVTQRRAFEDVRSAGRRSASSDGQVGDSVTTSNVDGREIGGTTRIRTFACVYTAPDTTVSRRELAYEALKNQLLHGDFAPGERLGEERLAESLGVSRTPVRDALTRLHGDGLIERLPDGGYAPTLVDLHLIRELYDVRFALETWSVRQAHDPARLGLLWAEWNALEPPSDEATIDPDFVRRDEAFHEGLAAATGNSALVANLRAVNERIRIVRMHDFLLLDRIADTISEHLSIVEALVEGDRVTGERRLTAHFDDSLAVVEERAALALARMIKRRGR